MSSSRFLVLMLTTVVGTSLAADDATYVNEKHHFTVAYPKSFFRLSGAIGRGDGQSFDSVDGRAQFSVSMTTGTMLQESCRTALSIPARSVTYRVVRPTWCVVSGVQGDRISYEKRIAE